LQRDGVAQKHAQLHSPLPAVAHRLIGIALASQLAWLLAVRSTCPIKFLELSVSWAGAGLVLMLLHFIQIRDISGGAIASGRPRDDITGPSSALQSVLGGSETQSHSPQSMEFPVRACSRGQDVRDLAAAHRCVGSKQATPCVRDVSWVGLPARGSLVPVHRTAVDLAFPGGCELGALRCWELRNTGAPARCL
jgi:hypothetical protein